MEEENNNKVKKEKIKRKRKVSILTVFLWITLIAVMSVITINGIVKNNAVEGETRTITIKVDFSEYFESFQIEGEEEKIGFMKNAYNINIFKTNNITEESDFLEETTFVTNEGNIGIYEVEVTDEAKYIMYHSKNFFWYKLFNVISEKNEIIEINDEIHNNIYYGEKIVEGQDVYEVKVVKDTSNVSTLKINFLIEGLNEESKKNVYNEILKIEPDEAIGGFDTYSYYFENGNLVMEFYIFNPENRKYRFYELGFNDYFDYAQVEGKDMLCKYEFEGKTKYFTEFRTAEVMDLKPANLGEEKTINVTFMYFDVNTRAIQKAKWIDRKTGLANIELGYTSTGHTFQFISPMSISPYDFDGIVIFKSELPDEFILSNEYENMSQWSILESTSSEEMARVPVDVLNEFNIVEEKSSTGKKYVYVKDTNTVYWLEDEIKLREGSTSVNVLYKDYEKLTDGVELKSSKNTTLIYNYGSEYYNIEPPKLKFIHKNEAVIKVEKNIKGEVGSNIYYVGVFNNEDDKKTDKVYEIKTIDGKGDIVIDTLDYAKEKEYYIYEVDKEGNKVTDKSIKYSSNKMEFDKVRDAKIESDKNIVSSIMSDDWSYDRTDTSKWHEYVDEYGYVYYGDSDTSPDDEEDETEYYFETDAKNSKGTGEEDYIDNVLSVNDIYQSSVTITSEKKENEKKYKVEYVAEEGGTLEGTTKETVKANEYVTNVPKVVPNEGYKFVRFEVEENGERIEVEPSKYAITKDTVFYAIFEKIPEEVIGLPNTSDINVYMYVGIFVIAIIVIVIVLLIINKNKTNKK